MTPLMLPTRNTRKQARGRTAYSRRKKKVYITVKIDFPYFILHMFPYLQTCVDYRREKKEKPPPTPPRGLMTETPRRAAHPVVLHGPQQGRPLPAQSQQTTNLTCMQHQRFHTAVRRPFNHPQSSSSTLTTCSTGVIAIEQVHDFLLPPRARPHKRGEHVLLHLPPQRSTPRGPAGPSDGDSLPHGLEHTQRGPQVSRVPEAAYEYIVVVGLPRGREKRARRRGRDVWCWCVGGVK